MVTLSGVYGGRDAVHTEIRKYLMNVILPQLFKKYAKLFSKNKFYMVVIGGMSVERCANLSRPSRRFLRDIFSEDIDIKCVFLRNVKSLDDAYVLKVHKIRMDFIQDVIDSLKIQVAQIQFDEGVQVQAEIDDSLLASTVDKVRLSQVVGININYTENQRRFDTPILDTSLYNSLSSPLYFDKYKHMTNSKTPIPYVIHDGVPYATCNYCYYETVRLFLDRIEYFAEKKSMYALMKFYRNVVKFMSLYVMRHKINSLPPKLHKIYTEVHGVLKKIDLQRIQSGFRKELSGIKYEEEYVKKVVGILKEVIDAVKVEDIIRSTVKEIQMRYAST
jgi:hypothetical protein